MTEPVTDVTETPRSQAQSVEHRCRAATVWLWQADEQYAPPEQDVVGVSCVGDQLFLYISTLTENGENQTYTEKEHASVDLITFLKAVFTTVDSGRFAQILHLADMSKAVQM